MTNTTELQTDELKKAYINLSNSYDQLKLQYNGYVEKYVRMKSERDNLIKVIQSIRRHCDYDSPTIYS